MIEPLATPSHAWQAAVRPMRRVGHAIEAHDRIGSTNDRARTLLDAPSGDGSVVLAEEQTGGRGRLGRSWLSPAGRNLTFSVALRPRLAPADAWQLGMGAALGVAAASAAAAPVRLKWPNDVEGLDGRKVGGLLIETITEGERLRGAIVGIGLNVNWPRAEMPAEIAARATSLSDLAGRPIDRADLLRALLDALSDEIEGIEAGRSPLERYRDACSTLGAFVTVATPDGAVHGRAVDLDPTGALVVEAEDGRHALAGGEVVRVQRGGAP